MLSTLRKMPLFLRSRPSQSGSHLASSGQPSMASKYVQLDQSGMQYLALFDDTRHLKLKHAGQLQLLELEGLCFVAPGGNELRQLYERLDVKTMDTLSFVKERLPQKLLYAAPHRNRPGFEYKHPLHPTTHSPLTRHSLRARAGAPCLTATIARRTRSLRS